MRGREAKLKRLLASIPEEYERIVVDDEHLLLAAKRNAGAKKASGEYLLFVDDDNVLEDGAIENMLFKFHDRIGVMGMTACYSSDRTRIADGGSLRSMLTGFTQGLRTNKKLVDEPTSLYRVDEVANAFMVKASLFYSLGGFNELLFPIELDEADFCRRVKDIGLAVVMNPLSVCYHDSQTHSYIPDFRRPLSAYFMGRNRLLFQNQHLQRPRLFLYLILFMPVFVMSYSACLLYRRKPWMVIHFMRGVIDGLFGRLKNKYQ